MGSAKVGETKAQLPDTEREYYEREGAQRKKEVPNEKRWIGWLAIIVGVVLFVFFGLIKPYMQAWPERNREFWAEFNARAEAEAQMLARENDACDQRLATLLDGTGIPNPREQGWGVARYPMSVKKKNEFITRESSGTVIVRSIDGQDGVYLGTVMERRRTMGDPPVVEEHIFMFFTRAACYDGEIPDGVDDRHVQFFETRKG